MKVNGFYYLSHERDAKRSVAPMKPAPDANIIDTSEMSMNEVFEKALSLIKH
jgi:cytidylate kinase